MKTIGHVRFQVGDARILGEAYRVLQRSVDAGDSAVTSPGMLRFRQILDEIRSLSQQEQDINCRVYASDVWGVAA